MSEVHTPEQAAAMADRAEREAGEHTLTIRRLEEEGQDPRMARGMAVQAWHRLLRYGDERQRGQAMAELRTLQREHIRGHARQVAHYLREQGLHITDEMLEEVVDAQEAELTDAERWDRPPGWDRTPI